MSNLSGTDKSVILLMTIGEDRAAEVFKHLSTREVQALSTAMANVRQISNKQLTDVLSEFEQEAEQFAALNINANEYLRSVLVKALGEERASSLLEDILETRDTTSGIETLNFMEPQSAADLIRDEHPQIIATILVHLKRSQAADILALFDERLRHDVMLRIATFGGVQPAARVNAFLFQKDNYNARQHNNFDVYYIHPFYFTVSDYAFPAVITSFWRAFCLVHHLGVYLFCYPHRR